MIKAFRKLLLQQGFEAVRVTGGEVFVKDIDGVNVLVTGNKKRINILCQKKNEKTDKVSQCKLYVPIKKIETRELQLLTVESAILSAVKKVNEGTVGNEVIPNEKECTTNK